MKKAIYPGSFDPITRGHLDIIERASKIFDEVIVVIMENPAKHYTFSEKERLGMLNDSCKELPNVRCEVNHGLSIHFAQSHDANVMIRGIRAVQDYEFELQTATANMWIDDHIETLFFLSKPEYSFLSSSTVKELASHGEDVSRFVNGYVANKLSEKYKK